MLWVKQLQNRCVSPRKIKGGITSEKGSSHEGGITSQNWCFFPGRWNNIRTGDFFHWEGVITSEQVSFSQEGEITPEQPIVCSSHSGKQIHAHRVNPNSADQVLEIQKKKKILPRVAI